MDFAENLASIQERIAAACARAHRNPATVTLLAVSKGMPPGRIQEAARGGLVHFGENKVQEAAAKIPLCPGRLHWHFIGHLQSNKCRDAARLFAMVQSVDSAGLAQELDKWGERLSKTIPILLEVNLAGEATKFGFRTDQLLAGLEAIHSLKRLEIQGLMTIAPWSPDPEKARPVFRKLREARRQCEERLGAPLPHLSMGMSGDFEVAIEEGATLVRIGTALFGARPKRTAAGTLEDGP